MTYYYWQQCIHLDRDLYVCFVIRFEQNTATLDLNVDVLPLRNQGMLSNLRKRGIIFNIILAIFGKKILLLNKPDNNFIPSQWAKSPKKQSEGVHFC